MDEGRHGGEHLDPIRLASYLDGRLEGAAREEIEAHLAGCAECRAGAVLLRTMPVEEEAIPIEMLERARAVPPPGAVAAHDAAPHGAPHAAPSHAVPEPADASWIYRFVTGVAAAVVIAIALGAWYRLGPPPPGQAAAPYRGTEQTPFDRLEPGPGEKVSAADLRFRWGAIPGADRYVVKVLDARGEIAATLETRAGVTEAAWPAAAPKTPGVYIWSVRALALDRTLAESRPIPFEIQ